LSKVGYVSIVLHAHLPYVRHPKTPECLEELWLMEAITETYIPIIEVMDGLLRDNVPFRLTMSITPTLASMLADGFLQERYHRHITKLCELAEKRSAAHPLLCRGSKPWQFSTFGSFKELGRLFEDCHYRLLDRFIALEKTGFPGDYRFCSHPWLFAASFTSTQRL